MLLDFATLYENLIRIKAHFPLDLPTGCRMAWAPLALPPRLLPFPVFHVMLWVWRPHVRSAALGTPLARAQAAFALDPGDHSALGLALSGLSSPAEFLTSTALVLQHHSFIIYFSLPPLEFEFPVSPARRRHQQMLLDC